MESIVEGLIEAKLRRLKEEFHLEIERLDGDNKELKADNKKLNDKVEEMKADNEILKENYKRLLNERENDVTASATGF